MGRRAPCPLSCFLISILLIVFMHVPRRIGAFQLTTTNTIFRQSTRGRRSYRQPRFLLSSSGTSSMRSSRTVPGSPRQNDGTRSATSSSSSTEIDNNRPDLSQSSHGPTSLPPPTFWPSPATTPPREERDHNNNDASRRIAPSILDSILKVHCTHNEPDCIMPWQRQHPTTSTSSGFVISLLPTQDPPESDTSRLRIMTNAHSVEYGSLVQVQRRGDDRKYTAQVETLANACDLAILRVDDEAFWETLQPLPFGTALPVLQDTVHVVGYPTGGDALSVTQGVVSRVEQLEYTQGCTRQLAIQIDAAINAGNSGGPVMMMGQRQNNEGGSGGSERCVVGVAFQGLEGAENIGYVVPVTVVQHVLHDIQRNGKYTGFCSLGIQTSLLENKAFRKSLRLPEGQSGIMVHRITESSSCHGVLHPNDVIAEVDGIPVANDGKVPFRPGERVSLSCYIQTKFVDDKVALTLWRNGSKIEQTVSMGVTHKIVPTHWGDTDRPPPYVIVAGLVFTALSIPYLQASNAWESYCSDGISYLLGKWREPRLRPGDQIVVLAQVLVHAENLGYEHGADLHLLRVNGQDVRSLRQLQDLLLLDDQQQQDPFVRFEFAEAGGHDVMVLDRAAIQQATAEVCDEHGIQKPYFFPEDSNDEEEHFDGEV